MIILVDDYIYQYKKVIDNLRYAQGLQSQFGISTMNDMIIDELLKEELNNYHKQDLIKAMKEYIDHINHLYYEFNNMKQGIKDYVASNRIIVDKPTGEYFAISIHLATSLAGLKFLSKKSLDLYDFEINKLENSFEINKKCKNIISILEELFILDSKSQVEPSETYEKTARSNWDNPNNRNEQYFIQNELNIKSIFKKTGIFVIIMLLIGIMDLPYGYYVILRIIVFAFAFITTFYNYTKNRVNNDWWFTIPLAILYNPIILIHLTKPIWITLNLISVILIGYIIYKLDTSIEQE